MTQKTPTDYQARWQRVEKLLHEEGLTRSAVAEIREIHALAKKENQQAQALKALVYLSEELDQVSEEANPEIIQLVQDELAGSKTPEKQLLHSLLAAKYQQIYEENRWELMDRTPVSSFDTLDMETWSIKDFHRMISQHYLASLENAETLKNTELKNYEPLIHKGNASALRPSLYDLLAHQALRYFTNDERDLPEPANVFLVDDPQLLAAAGDFSRAKIQTSDSSSLYYQAILIYQELIAMHLDDKDPSALLDVDMERLEFIRQHSVHPDTDALYEKAMEDIAARYPEHPKGAEAAVNVLNIRMNRSDEEPKERYVLNELEKAYKKIIDQFPSTPAAQEAYAQWKQITDSSLSVQTELVNSPQKPFLALAKFRNINRFHYRIIALDQDDPIVQRTEHYWEDLVTQTAIRTASVTLPDAGDRRMHSAEIGIDGLPAGRYALLCSVSPEFVAKDNLLSVQYFHVSGIAYLNKDNEYFVLDRETGKPLAGAWVELVKSTYNSAKKKNDLIPINNTISNSQGYAKINMPRNYNGPVMVDIKWNDDRLFTSNMEYRYSNREETSGERTTGVLFTDRAIYRPGQPLFFKGLLIQGDKEQKKNNVIPNRKVEVILEDANGERVDSLELTSNAFGSIHGEFRLPQGRLTGNYSLSIVGTTISNSFQVEEYKRPSFEVSFDPITASFRLNEEIKLQGKVAGYAGNMLNDAHVHYRVVRNVRLPWWWGYFRPRGRNSAEIASGKLTTDANGKFEISFKAIPDASVDKKMQPSFDYTVYVDATDNSGETRSNEQHVMVAYHAMEISLGEGGKKEFSDTLGSLPVSIRNLAGQSLTADLSLEIRELETPKRLIRERYWNAPDTAVMDREAFIRAFPHDAYMDENDEKNWKTIATNTIQYKTVKDGETLRFKPLQAGTYRLILKGKDKYGEEVRDEKLVTIISTKDPGKNRPAYVINPQPVVKADPGQKVRLQLGSSADSITMIRTVNNGDGEQLPILVWTKGGMMAWEVRPTENDRGGIGITHAFVKHNRFHNIEQVVEVAWSNKALKLSTMTYRDKLLPGAKETWKLKIAGVGSDKAAAELLTSMYDASLDQFVQQNWSFPKLFRSATTIAWNGQSNFKEGYPEEKDNNYRPYPLPVKPVVYDELLWKELRNHRQVLYSARGAHREMMAMSAAPPMADNAVVDSADAIVNAEYVTVKKNITGAAIATKNNSETPPSPRKNFTETAFFFPALTTDKDGNVELSFTMPESLTKWKWMSFAHTKDLATGMLVKEIVTQKELMVQPNMPRFLREGDRITLTARVSNLADKAVTGEATLQLIDPETNAPVDGLFKNAFPVQYFTAEAKQTTAVQFEIEVPGIYTKPLQYRVIAKAGNFSDGEENVIPVLSNRILVTESLPLQMIGNGTQTFTFNNLLNNNANSITHYRITTEYSSNPAWYAVLSLPYLMEYPYECAEQTFSRLYANALASNISNSSPAIKAMFEKWRTSDTAALISNLMKNQDLKQVLIENTPWVFEAKTESAQRKNIALLFEAERISAELYKNIGQLKDMQGPNGAFPWFKGGPDNRYITQYIITGIVRLKLLHAVPAEAAQVLEEISERGLEYLDQKLVEDHKYLLREKADLSKQHIGPIQVQYLYMRSFFDDAPEERKAYDFYYEQARKYWLQLDRQSQAMLAIALHRVGSKDDAQRIMRSLKENAIVNPMLGMYWKENIHGYFWYQAPVETQSMMIEAFDEVANDKVAVEQLKLWLLNQKRVQAWESTKATADAVYALMRKGSNWLSASPQATLTLGSQVIRPAAEEAGTGYTRAVIEGAKVKKDMGRVSVEVKGDAGLSWGAVHWQYFEDVDKVKASATPLQLRKQFFVERMSASGPVLEEIREGQGLRVGDKLKVRVVLRADRDMEFIHMKDMRASGTEPGNVLSGYRWQGGLGFYEATRDASTDFFFDWLPKGTWVFEYPLYVTHAGQFTAGICTVQSMYAPEFNAHSEGRKIGAGPRE